MDIRWFELLKKLEQTVGTNKLMRCICLGGMGFLLGMIILPDNPNQNLIENNKEEN